MRRFLTIAAVVLAACGVIFARGGMQPPTPDAARPVRPAVQPQNDNKKPIDLKSDLSGPIASGDSVIFLVGNFAAQNNGTVITCDSAVRYSDTRIEFFGNVLINKNTTYIYGDRADYDGNLNLAHVYSDLIKVVDGDATLYTYQFEFNTLTNIGRFNQGGVLTNRDSRLEAIRGYYYSDTKNLIGVDQVQMRNDEYELTGDSVVYNIETDNAWFYDRTNIWSKDGDYLYADKGEYQKNDTLYIVTRNGYVLTEKQEMWSDSINFYRAKNHVILHSNIQIDDTEHKVLAFGDYGEYWKEPGNAILTRRPSMVSYDLSQGDSLFMRSDSMFLYTIDRREEAKAALADSLAKAAMKADSAALSTEGGSEVPGGQDSLVRGKGGVKGEIPDSLRVGNAAGGDEIAADSLGASPNTADSLGAGNAADSVQLTPAQQKAKLKEAEKKAREEAKAAASKAKKELLDKIAAKRKAKMQAKLKEEQEREEARLAAMRVKAESRMLARRARAARKGKLIQIDSTSIRRIDSLIERNYFEQDSLMRTMLDSLAASEAVRADTTDSAAMLDTLYRLVKGYRNVRIYRSDFQAVCDSVVGISTDSTAHLYIDPVLWNANYQITSDVMDIYTKNQQITHADFVGSPMMVGQLDTAHYNQVAGKAMTAYFRNNEIFRNDVNGNAQTIYYMQDGEPPVITMFATIESGNISFYIEKKQVVGITYRIDPVYHFYPLDKIPADQSLFLKDFKWEGARRPTQADVFDRTIRPSDRAVKSRLRHPDFPILIRVDEYKKNLIQQRRWFDRNEKIDPETVEWMHDLGYEVGQPRKSGSVFN